MYYLWFNELGSGWQLIEQSEDEQYIRDLEKQKGTELATMNSLTWGSAYTVTDYLFPDEERYHEEEQ